MTPLSSAFVLLVLAAFADVATTRAGLRTGAMVEANPLMRPFVMCTRRALVVKSAALVVVGWGVFDLARWGSPRLALALTLAGAALNAWHAWRNYRLLRAWLRRHRYDDRIDAVRYWVQSQIEPPAPPRHSVGDTEADIAELRAAARELECREARILAGCG